MKNFEKYTLLFTILFSLQFQVFSQVNGKECSAKMRKLAGPRVDSTLLNMRKSQLRISANSTYMIKLFVVIFADDDGSNVAASSDDVRRQIENMSDFYRPHNICFVLGGTQVSTNTDHNNHNVDSEEDEVSVYRRTGFVTILVHNTLRTDDDPTLNGSAYAIPNNYLSIVGSAIASTTNLSTLAHEMGHCFGLFHTFETHPGDPLHGKENVLRFGDCRDCEEDGDYLCDTNADLELGNDDVDATDCRYIGGLNFDDCGPEALLYETQNIMAYGRRSCRNHFSNGQGARARDFIVSDGDLSEALAVENLVQSLPRFYDDGLHMYTARNSVTFDLGYEATGTARISISADEIIMKPGVEFRPTAGVGYAILRPNTFCNN
jgi:hypothetical protein